MVKKGKRKQQLEVSSTDVIIGLLADDTVTRSVEISDNLKSITIGKIISDIGVGLQDQVNTVFGLNDNPITLNIKNARVPGILNYDANDSLADVTNQLTTPVTVLYSPIKPHNHRITSSVNHMVVDQMVSRFENSSISTSTPSRRQDKTNQLLRSLDSRLILLEGSNTALRHRVAFLEDRVALLEDDNYELQQAISGHTSFLFKIRRRILLDKAREQIISVWAPLAPKYRRKQLWNDFCKIFTVEDLIKYISLKNIFPHKLTDNAIVLIYVPNVAVREDGNKAAHEADDNLIEEAVLKGDPADVEVLKNIFRCVYNKDLH